MTGRWVPCVNEREAILFETLAFSSLSRAPRLCCLGLPLSFNIVPPLLPLILRPQLSSFKTPLPSSPNGASSGYQEQLWLLDRHDRADGARQGSTSPPRSSGRPCRWPCPWAHSCSLDIKCPIFPCSINQLLSGTRDTLIRTKGLRVPLQRSLRSLPCRTPRSEQQDLSSIETLGPAARTTARPLQAPLSG